MSSDKWRVYIPATVLAVLGFVIAFQFVDPAPPSTLIFSSGQHGARMMPMQNAIGLILSPMVLMCRC